MVPHRCPVHQEGCRAPSSNNRKLLSIIKRVDIDLAFPIRVLHNPKAWKKIQAQKTSGLIPYNNHIWTSFKTTPIPVCPQASQFSQVASLAPNTCPTSSNKSSPTPSSLPPQALLALAPNPKSFEIPCDWISRALKILQDPTAECFRRNTIVLSRAFSLSWSKGNLNLYKCRGTWTFLECPYYKIELHKE